MDPSTFLGSVWDMIWGVKYLLRRCLDPQGIYIYETCHTCSVFQQIFGHRGASAQLRSAWPLIFSTGFHDLIRCTLKKNPMNWWSVSQHETHINRGNSTNQKWHFMAVHDFQWSLKFGKASNFSC